MLEDEAYASEGLAIERFRQGCGGGEMAEAALFLIEEVFDVRSRGGLLVSGKVLAGEVSAGETLRDAVTGEGVRVLGVEFETPKDRELGRTTLVVERTSPTPVAIGRVLTT